LVEDRYRAMREVLGAAVVRADEVGITVLVNVNGQDAVNLVISREVRGR
jgi:hypothetical protein